jgi:hypothetical protein
VEYEFEGELYQEGEEEEEENSRDVAIDAALASVQDFFNTQPRRLFYSTQIETSLEREHFHWITGKALLELANAGRIQRETATVQGNRVNFYAHSQHRYWRRELGDMKGLLECVFHPDFAQAVGRHGELMFDAALGRAGFRTEATNCNSWQGVRWIKTNHKSYNHEIIQSGGYVWLFEDQMYPFGHKELLTQVRDRLGLRVHSPIDVKEGDVQRFMKWHDRKAKKTR